MKIKGNDRRECGNNMSLKQFVFRMMSIAAVLLIIHEVYFQQMAALEKEIVYEDKEYKSMAAKNFSMGSLLLPGIDSNTPIMTVKGMKDLNGTERLGPDEYWEEALEERAPVVEILEKAGIKIDLDLLYRLPRWDEVTELYGSEPVILGQEHCAAYREKYPRSERTAALAGMFNTGTNAMAMYFNKNLRNPDNNAFGFTANVPWHKHGWVGIRGQYQFKPPKDVNKVLPVVIIRDPYGWFQSMCESPYLVHGDWVGENCPKFVPTNLTLGMKLEHKKTWNSLAHMWSEWYGNYFDADFPRLMIRFEGTNPLVDRDSAGIYLAYTCTFPLRFLLIPTDVLYHTPQVMDAIRACVDGEWKEEHFVYQTASSKGGKKYFGTLIDAAMCNSSSIFSPILTIICNL